METKTMLVHYPKLRRWELVLSDAQATKQVTIAKREKVDYGAIGFIANDINHPNKDELKRLLDKEFLPYGLKVDYIDEEE